MWWIKFFHYISFIISLFNPYSFPKIFIKYYHFLITIPKINYNAFVSTDVKKWDCDSVRGLIRPGVSFFYLNILNRYRICKPDSAYGFVENKSVPAHIARLYGDHGKLSVALSDCLSLLAELSLLVRRKRHFVKHVSMSTIFMRFLRISAIF